MIFYILLGTSRLTAPSQQAPAAIGPSVPLFSEADGVVIILLSLTAIGVHSSGGGNVRSQLE